MDLQQQLERSQFEFEMMTWEIKLSQVGINKFNEILRIQREIDFLTKPVKPNYTFSKN